jgi:hypothetical protein
LYCVIKIQLDTQIDPRSKKFYQLYNRPFLITSHFFSQQFLLKGNSRDLVTAVSHIGYLSCGFNPRKSLESRIGSSYQFCRIRHVACSSIIVFHCGSNRYAFDAAVRSSSPYHTSLGTKISCNVYPCVPRRPL